MGLWTCSWPLLTGERGHYELAAGRDPLPYLSAMERFSNRRSCCPNRSGINRHPARAAPAWLPDRQRDAPDVGACRVHQVVRSASDARVFDLIDEVKDRDPEARTKAEPPSRLEIDRRVKSVSPGDRLRIQATQPFTLHWLNDEWQHVNDIGSISTPIGFDYVDLDIGADDRAPVRFTFNWRETRNWEGRDYAVAIAR